MSGEQQMELWFTEKHTSYVQFSIKIKKQLFGGKSKFQDIAIFDSEEFGRILTLDGYLMLTQKDEFIYHEMIVHVPMTVLPSVKKVLIIGGGDGGAAREVLRYRSVESIDLVDIDEMVTQVCCKYIPQTAISFADPRVHSHFEDGLKYIRHYENEYDLIIVDSTDPFGPGEGLFTKEFYGNCYRALKADGIMVNQHESPFYDNDAYAMKRAHKRIFASFPICKLYQAHIPTYPSGHWLFGFASKKYHPVDGVDWQRWQSLGIKTRYYNPKLHVGAFALPTYVEDMVREIEEEH